MNGMVGVKLGYVDVDFLGEEIRIALHHYFMGGILEDASLADADRAADQAQGNAGVDQAARNDLQEIDVNDLVGQAVPLARLYEGAPFFARDLDPENGAFRNTRGYLEEFLLVEKNVGARSRLPRR